MTWEEVIQEIRRKPEFAGLVQDAYLDADLAKNATRFLESGEFAETLQLLASLGIQKGASVLDIGAGNGIATAAFARSGFKVCAVEPDPSNTVGSGAIRKLVQTMELGAVEIIDLTAENMQVPQGSFDLAYIRQAVHHAHDLQKFVSNAVSALKPGGVYLAVRDHVVFDEKDKQWFLDSHPLHKHYGGENAFSLKEYLTAMENAGLTQVRYWSYYSSPINYLPLPAKTLEEKKAKRETLIRNSLRSKLGPLADIRWIQNIYAGRVEKKLGPALDERLVPGRPYSFAGIKP